MQKHFALLFHVRSLFVDSSLSFLCAAFLLLFFIFIFHSFYAQQILCAFNCAPDDIIDGICRNNSNGVHANICASPHRHLISVRIARIAARLCAVIYEFRFCVCGACTLWCPRTIVRVISNGLAMSQRRAYWHLSVGLQKSLPLWAHANGHFVANNVAHLFHATFHLCN